jgi:hypothetical protein
MPTKTGALALVPDDLTDANGAWRTSAVREGPYVPADISDVFGDRTAWTQA